MKSFAKSTITALIPFSVGVLMTYSFGVGSGRIIDPRSGVVVTEKKDLPDHSSPLLVAASEQILAAVDKAVQAAEKATQAAEKAASTVAAAAATDASTSIHSKSGAITSPYDSTLPQQKRDGPFQMPINGERFSIFQPIYDTTISVSQLMAPTKDFIATFQQRIEWVGPMVVEPEPINKEIMTSNEHAKFMYLEMMKNILTAMAFSNAERSVPPKTKLQEGEKLSLNPLNPTLRSTGKDWTFAGDTMTGSARMDNIRDLLQDVVKNNVEGDYIETGVWRGGASIYARAVLATLGETDHRVSYVCDSFQGLPPGDRSLDRHDKGWESAYLEVPKEIVADNFNKYGLLDSNVVFAKGFFNETMPPLSKKIGTLAVMRLDVSTIYDYCFIQLVYSIFVCNSNDDTCTTSPCNIL